MRELPLGTTISNALAFTFLLLITWCTLEAMGPIEGGATENCVICGSDPDTRCPCDCTATCENLCPWFDPDYDDDRKAGMVLCLRRGIKSLSSTPIVLPKNKTELCVRADWV